MLSRSLMVGLLFSFSLATMTFGESRVAQAQQVSDADRKAARDLYQQGVTSQQASKFAEALDSFQRSFQVFPAPTTALHIAQCQTSLGHLVEAEEDYRALASAKIPDNSPPAFYQAQDQAKSELATVEPRVPRVKIIVTPERVTGLTVTIDGQSMNAALVGVPRPLDPGTHRISASAPGYTQVDQTITVQERDARDVRMTLAANGITPLPQNGGYRPPNGVNNGQQQNGGNYVNPAYSAWTPPKPKPKGPSAGLLIGVALGANIAAGGLYGETTTLNSDGTSTSDSGKISDATNSVGFALGLNLGLRFARIGYLGGVIEGDFSGNGALGSNSNSAFKTSGKASLFGLVIGLMTNPEGVGFYGTIGGGYRTLGISATAANGSSDSFAVAGPEFLLELGIQIKASLLRIVPKASLGAGAFTSESATNGATSTSGSINNSTGHAFFMLGITTFFEIPLGGGSAAASATSSKSPIFSGF